MSPDGSLVTFMGNRIGGPGAIRFLAGTDGSEPQELGLPLAENCGWNSSSGTWSPDGTRIVCGQGGILVVDVATEETSIVAEGKGAIWVDDHTLLAEAWGK